MHTNLIACHYAHCSNLDMHGTCHLNVHPRHLARLGKHVGTRTVL